eukprot:scaffold462_cov195-Pinguiococcus_pyrenoidosus.AAC.64
MSCLAALLIRRLDFVRFGAHEAYQKEQESCQQCTGSAHDGNGPWRHRLKHVACQRREEDPAGAI